MKTDKVNIGKEFVSTRRAEISGEISIFPFTPAELSGQAALFDWIRGGFSAS
jgi:hypothetical protein